MTKHYKRQWARFMQISANNVPNLRIFYVRRTRHANEVQDLWFHGGVYSDYTFLGCDTVTYCKRATKYMHLAPTAVGSCMQPSIVIWPHYFPTHITTVDGGRISLAMLAYIRMNKRPQRSEHSR